MAPCVSEGVFEGLNVIKSLAQFLAHLVITRYVIEFFISCFSFLQFQ